MELNREIAYRKGTSEVPLLAQGEAQNYWTRGIRIILGKTDRNNDAAHLITAELTTD